MKIQKFKETSLLERKIVRNIPKDILYKITYEMGLKKYNI